MLLDLYSIVDQDKHTVGAKNQRNMDFVTTQVCAICGVLCISLPIPIIVNNFNNIYEKSKIEEEIKAKKTKSSWEDANRGQHQHHHHHHHHRYCCVVIVDVF